MFTEITTSPSAPFPYIADWTVLAYTTLSIEGLFALTVCAMLFGHVVRKVALVEFWFTNLLSVTQYIRWVYVVVVISAYVVRAREAIAKYN